MLEFSRPDMSCGHCAGTATQTCKLVDPSAQVEVDVNLRKATIKTSEAREDFAQALTEAGYPPAA